MSGNPNILEGLFEDLHIEVAKDLLNRVRTGEATAAELSVAVKFLKDNQIEGIRKPGSPLDQLADTLPVFTNDEVD
jgi:hypothetical protein